METQSKNIRQFELAKSIQEIDRQLCLAQDTLHFATLEKQLANALEQMLRQTITKPTGIH